VRTRDGGHEMIPDSIVGRERELTLLSTLVASAGEQGGALVVTGAPGIGKSTLVAASVREADARGMRVLSAVGVQSEAHLPFAGLHQVLRPVLDRLERLPRALGTALRVAFGLEEAPPPEPFRIALAALELLAEVAVDSALVVVVEDAHWIDRPTADVLSFVARRIDAEPVLLLMVVRAGFDTPLVKQGLPEMRVDPLDPVHAARLLDDLAPDLRPWDRERVLAAAVGTPLALMELPTSFRDGAAPSPVPGGDWVLSERLEQAYMTRVDALPAHALALVRLVATDDSDDLSEVLAAAPSVIDGWDGSADDLQPAIEAGVLEVSEGRVRFRHPLMRSAVYQAARDPERRRAHSALAGVLDRQPDRRAWHLAASTSQPTEHVAAEVERMAVRSQARGGTTAAFAALRRAAELTPDLARRGERLLRAAATALELGEPESALPLMDVAEALITARVPRARLELLRHSIDPGRPGDPATVLFLVETAEEMALVGEIDLALAFLTAAAMQSWWADPGEPARERVVVSVARLPVAQQDPRVLAIMGFADPQRHGEVVIQRAAQLLPAQLEPEASHLLGSALNVAGAFDESAAHLKWAVSGLRERGRLGLLPAVLTQQAWTAINRLDWGVAVPAADEAARLGRETAQPMWVAAAQTGQAMIRGLRGDELAADELLLEAETAVLAQGASAVLAGIQLTRGVTALGAWRYADSFGHLMRLFDPADPSYHRVQSTWAVGDLAEAAVHSGGVEAAREVVARLESDAQTSANRWLHVGLLFARPLLADPDQAETHFQTGLRTDLSRWPLYRARLLSEYGAWLRRQRRVTESRAPLRAARDTFDAFGLRGWGERARQELRASGEASAPPQPEAWSSLSPQELQIALLAAQGLTNRQIGARLYLSHRTVGSHLYRIFPKLGITFRSQLREMVPAVRALSSSE